MKKTSGKKSVVGYSQKTQSDKWKLGEKRNMKINAKFRILYIRPRRLIEIPFF